MSYYSPTDLETALQLAAYEGQTVIAGGTDVFPAMQQGRSPAQLLDVTRINAFTRIDHSPDYVRIGAAVSWTGLKAAELPPAFNALKEAASDVGGVQIQNAGTIVGNICNASPAADGVPALLTLDAEIEVASAARGIRVVKLTEFITGVRQTILEPDELVTAILVPTRPADAKSAFEKLGSRAYLVISITMTSAMIRIDPDGAITEAKVAVGACSAVACRLPELETSLIGASPDNIKVLAHHLPPLSPIDDIRASAEFRVDVVAEQCKRAIMRAALR